MRREARTLAALDHPNVVPLYGAGEEDGAVFIATRWIDGIELGDLIRRDHPMRPRRSARLAAQIASALEVAHEQDLLHRNIKPSNVIVTAEDHVYLTDFGLTKRAESLSGFTRSGQMLGTIEYVAPEQIEGGDAGPFGDVYSLACVLYEMLAGCPPFARRERRDAQDVGAPQRPAAVDPRAAARRARSARRGDPPGDGEAAGRPALGGGVRGGCAACGGRDDRDALAAVERVGVEHHPPERDPRGAVVGRVAAVEPSAASSSFSLLGRLAGGVGRPRGRDERHGMLRAAGRLAADRSCSTGMSAGGLALERGPGPAAIRRPGRVGILGDSGRACAPRRSRSAGSASGSAGGPIGTGLASLITAQSGGRLPAVGHQRR